MSLTRAGFQALTDKMVNSVFSDFSKSLTVQGSPTFNPLTGETTYAQSFTVSAVEGEINYSQFQGQSIQIGDFKATYPYQYGSFVPKTSDKFTFGGRECQAVAIDVKGESAVVVYLRAK